MEPAGGVPSASEVEVGDASGREVAWGESSSLHLDIAKSALPSDSLQHLIGEDFRAVDPRNIQAEMIVTIITVTVVTAAILIGFGFLWFSFGFAWQTWLGVAAGLTLILLMYTGAFLWPKIEHRRTQYRIDQEGLEIRRGVLWRHQITIPLGRVQHADVSQGPIQRIFGIGTLTVHTAGTQNASIALEGLEHELAVAIRDLIVHQRRGQDAV